MYTFVSCADKLTTFDLILVKKWYIFPLFYNTLQLNFRQSKFTMVFQDMLIDFILLGSEVESFDVIGIVNLLR